MPPRPQWVPEINNEVVPVAETASDAANDTEGKQVSYRTLLVPVYYAPPKSESELAEEKAAVAKRVFAFRREQADRGSPLYQFLLGQCYLNGEGCQTNRVEGLTCIHRAANDGHADAVRFLKLQTERGTTSAAD